MSELEQPMPDRMEVSFAYTLDEAVDVMTRSLAQYPGFRRGLFRNALVTGVLTSIVILLLLHDGSFEQQLFLASVGFVLGSLGEFFLSSNFRKRRIRQVVKHALLGEVEPYACTFVVEPTGMTTIRSDQTLKHAWSLFDAVTDREHGVEFVSRVGGIACVRNRAFESPSQRAKFLELAGTFVEQGKKGKK